jgi:hypothetical protein
MLAEDKLTQSILSQTLIAQTLMTSGSSGSEVGALQSLAFRGWYSSEYDHQRLVLFRVCPSDSDEVFRTHFYALSFSWIKQCFVIRLEVA